LDCDYIRAARIHAVAPAIEFQFARINMLTTVARSGTRIGLALVLCLSVAAPQAQSVRLDVNDVAFLWPPPASADEVTRLIPATEPLQGSAGVLWPRPAFDLLLDTARSTTVMTSAGTTASISFTPFETEFAKPETWKVVGMRVDPSAPGSHPSLITQFGSTPQIRMILQPVTSRADGTVVVHDVTAHLAYSFVTAVDPRTRIPTPDKATFMEIVKDLVTLKSQAGAAGSVTTGPLGIHPALLKQAPGFDVALRTFLQRRLPQGRLTEMAFMGIDAPEPWIFFAMARRPDGSFVQVSAPSLGNQPAQMLTFRGGSAVMPPPRTTNFDNSTGVSTASLFQRTAGDLALTPVFPGSARPLHADIPDIVANPRLSSIRNTDCVSCHTESTRRSILRLTSHDPRLAFERPANVSGVAADVLPKSPWNVRNFGWFQSRDGTINPTVTMRAANEVAEAAAFANTEYLGAANPPIVRDVSTPARIDMSAQQQPVASPLTLVMDIKSANDFTALKALIEGIQKLPPEQNPIWQALTKLSTVHFARFVFLSDRQLAVITTYDGSFDDYIDAFVNALGSVFDKMLAHVADAPPLPVSEHRKEFLDYVRTHDLGGMPPFYSAYPHLKVLDILTMDKQRKPD
jgi:hypothetical protein